MSLRRTFQNDFARKAFQVIDGEERVIGKFGEIALSTDGSFDVWIVTPNRSPIGTRKLNNILSTIASWKPDIHALTGEAWFTTTNPALIREIGPQLGIPKRRRYCEETLERMREQARVNLGVSA